MITYDYRGTGRSGDPRMFRAVGIRDWMEVDVPAVSDWAHATFPDVPQLAVGHSIGGHALVLGHGTVHPSRFVTVSTHLAVMRRIERASERWRVGMILNVLGPALSRGLGYMPANGWDSAKTSRPA